MTVRRRVLWALASKRYRARKAAGRDAQSAGAVA
jgi:hypothetical protein